MLDSDGSVCPEVEVVCVPFAEESIRVEKTIPGSALYVENMVVRSLISKNVPRVRQNMKILIIHLILYSNIYKGINIKLLLIVFSIYSETKTTQYT